MLSYVFGCNLLLGAGLLSLRSWARASLLHASMYYFGGKSKSTVVRRELSPIGPRSERLAVA